MPGAGIGQKRPRLLVTGKKWPRLLVTGKKVAKFIPADNCDWLQAAALATQATRGKLSSITRVYFNSEADPNHFPDLHIRI